MEVEPTISTYLNAEGPECLAGCIYKGPARQHFADVACDATAYRKVAESETLGGLNTVERVLPDVRQDETLGRLRCYTAAYTSSPIQ